MLQFRNEPRLEILLKDVTQDGDLFAFLKGTDMVYWEAIQLESVRSYSNEVDLR